MLESHGSLRTEEELDWGVHNPRSSNEWLHVVEHVTLELSLTFMWTGLR